MQIKQLLASVILATGVFASSGAAPSLRPNSTVQPTSKDPVEIYEGFTAPFRQIEVAASENGRLAEVFAKRGDVIKPGHVLMVLDTRVLELSRKVASAKAKASARRNALRIEQQVQKQRHDKLVQLQRDGVANPEEVKRAEADARIATLNVDANEEELDFHRLELAEIESRIEQRRVRSPIGGIVTNVIKEEGEYVSLNEPHIATVVQLDRLRVTFFVPTEVALSLRRRDTIALRVEGVSEPTVGEIEYVGVVTEADSGRVRLDVLIDNGAATYRSGVRCRYFAKSLRQETS